MLGVKGWISVEAGDVGIAFTGKVGIGVEPPQSRAVQGVEGRIGTLALHAPAVGGAESWVAVETGDRCGRRGDNGSSGNLRKMVVGLFRHYGFISLIPERVTK